MGTQRHVGASKWHSLPAGKNGQAMVEFALIGMTLLVILFGLLDLLRISQANTTVAEAARQGARQAVAHASSSDSPFGSPNGQACSGMAYTSSMTGTGCLTDAAIVTTVKSVLLPITTSTTTYSNTPGWSCPTPTAGSANICISPSETGSGGSYSSCSNAISSLGRVPKPGELGSRSTEFSGTTYQGCFLVQVTVVFSYKTMTPLMSTVIGSNDKISASTAMVAEY